MESLSMQLQPFFEWLLRTTLQASLLICLILLFQVVLRSRLGARWHYCLWLLLLIRMAMPWAPQSRVSVFNLMPQSLPQRQTEYARQEVGDDSADSDVADKSTAESTPVSTTGIPQDSPEAITATPQIGKEAKGRLKPVFFEIADILPLVWLTGALALAVYVCASNFNLLRIVKRERPLTDQKILDLLEDCKAEMGIRIILGVVATDKVKSPALFGFIRPRLLLPKGMLETLSREELRYVFLHELAHLKRHDIYIGWLISLLQVLHWFNPLIWLAFYRVRTDRELACDALVLARTQSGESKDYGRTIVSLLERFSRSQPLPAMAGILETKAQLKRRIKMIARFKKNSYQWSPLTVILIIILACVSLPDAIGSKTLGISWPKSEPGISLRRIKTGPMSDSSSPPSLDGRHLCDVQYSPTRLVVRDLVTGEVRPLTEVSEGFPSSPVISPKNEHVAYIHQSWSPAKNELHLIRMDGTGHRVLYRFEDEQFYIHTWTPDGKQILGAFQKGDQDVQLVGFSIKDGSMQVIHTFETYWPSWRSPLRKLAISPDGRYIAYERPQKKGSWEGDIFILDIEHQQTERVVQHSTNDRLLGWTPDGSYLFFARDSRQGLPGGFTVTDTCDAYLLPVAEGRQQGAPELIKRDIPGKIRPKGFTRDGAYYYAIEFSSIEAVVAKLDMQTGNMLKKPQAVGQTGADQLPAWSPDGRHLAYCVHQLNNSQTIRIQNLETGQERELDPNLPHFKWLRWSPDGKSLLVSNFAKDSPRAIYRINANTGERVAVVQSESSDTLPGKPQLSPDGSTLYYVLRHSDSKKTSLVTRDTESGREEELFSLDGTRDIRQLTFALSPDGRQLALKTNKLTSSGAAVVSHILTMPSKGGEPRELWKTKGKITAPTIAWTPDGHSLLFTKRIPEGGRELWLIPSGGGQARKLCTPQEMRLPEMTYGGVYSALDVHPDGQRIAFDCFEYRHEVWAMENFLPGAPVAKPEPAVTLRRVEVRGRGRVHSRPSLDGKYMSDVDFDTGNLVVRDIATGKERMLTKNSDPNWFAYESLISPENKRVAFLQFNPKKEDFDLQVVGFDGSDDRLLWGAEEGARSFNMDAWSPDGRYIFGKLIGQDESVRLIRVSAEDGSRQVIKTFEGKWLFKVDVSPDGRYVAYDLAEQKASNRDIFVFDLEENRETPLVNHPANDKLLGWTPDGQHVFFTSDRNGTWDGWLLRVEDGKPRGLPEVIKAGMGDVSSIGFTRNGSFYYNFRHEAWNVYTATLDLDTGEVLSDPVPVRHVGKDVRPDWSPDGQYLAYCSEPDRNKPQVVRIRTLATGQERELKTDLPHFDWLRWCPDSQHLLITNFRRGSPPVVYKLDAQTGEHTALVRSDEQRIRQQAELSADGKTLAYRIRGSGNANRLIVRDMETGREKELLGTESMGAAALLFWALSPDGKHVALSVVALSVREGEMNRAFVLKIISVASGETRTVVGDSAGEMAWTSDGRDLLFVKGFKELWRVSAEGGEPRKLWEWKQMLWGLRIHPDGQRIAFFSGGNVSEMWVMENFLPTFVSQAK